MTERLYTQQQIRDVLKAQGASYEDNTSLPPKEADILAAIALAETPVFSSPGYSNYDRLGDLDRIGQSAGGGKTYGPSVTSFQIRTFREDYGTGTRRDQQWLLSSLRNGCQAALSIARSSGYAAWTTYVTGRYKAYLQEFYPPPPGVYVVVAGDTFYKIDAKLGFPRGTMQQANPGIDPRKLYGGLRLKIPASEVPYLIFTVQPGQTLYSIMKLAGYTAPTYPEIQKVAVYTGLPQYGPYTIYSGQTLRILKPGY